MLPFKLGFSVVLLVTVVFSAVILYFTRPRQVKLDLDGGNEPLGAGSDGARRDPFDILRPDDTVDGYPILPERFWKQMQLIKFFM